MNGLPQGGCFCDPIRQGSKILNDKIGLWNALASNKTAQGRLSSGPPMFTKTSASEAILENDPFLLRPRMGFAGDPLSII